MKLFFTLRIPCTSIAENTASQISIVLVKFRNSFFRTLYKYSELNTSKHISIEKFGSIIQIMFRSKHILIRLLHLFSLSLSQGHMCCCMPNGQVHLIVLLFPSSFSSYIIPEASSKFQHFGGCLCQGWSFKFSVLQTFCIEWNKFVI